MHSEVQKLVDNKNNINRTNNNLSQNFKILGNQNLLDTHKSICLLNCSSQNNYGYDIYKYCGNKRLNVADLLKFISENRRQ